jgi:hypothetical protein
MLWWRWSLSFCVFSFMMLVGWSWTFWTCVWTFFIFFLWLSPYRRSKRRCRNWSRLPISVIYMRWIISILWIRILITFKFCFRWIIWFWSKCLIIRRWSHRYTSRHRWIISIWWFIVIVFSRRCWLSWWLIRIV